MRLEFETELDCPVEKVPRLWSTGFYRLSLCRSQIYPQA